MLATVMSVYALEGQSLFSGVWDPLAGSPQGLHIRQAWVNTTYFSNGLGTTQGFGNPDPNLQSDFAISAGASFGWVRRRRDTSLSFNYAPSYVARARYSDLNASGHTINLSASKKVGKWSFTGSINGSVNSLQQFLSQPPVFGYVQWSTSTLQQMSQVVAQGSGQDLANVLLLSAEKQTSLPAGPKPVTINELPSGNVSNADLASILTGAPILKAAAANSLYNERGLNASADVAVVFEWTPRTSIKAGVTSSRTQYLSGASNVSRALPLMMSTGVNVDVHHSLSPDSSIGATMMSSKQHSSIQDSYTSTASVYFDRTFARRWFVRADIGASRVDSGRHLYSLPSGLQQHWGGTIGFHTRAQTFMGSVQQSAGDPYGLGGASTRSITGAWTWRPYTKTWSVFASVSQQDTHSLTFNNIGMWSSGAGYSRRLSSSLNIQAQYTGIWYQATFGPLPSNISLSGISVGLNWAPERAPDR